MIPIITINKCNSTNEEAMQHCLHQMPNAPLIIRGIEQTHGRGQGGTTWSAEPSANLTFSLILPMTFLPLHHQFALSQAVALACREYIQENLSDIKCFIKWPNDILVNDSKIGGILIENLILGSEWTYAIVGIGLNINQTEFSPDLNMATSLQSICGQTFQLENEMQSVAESLELGFQQLQSLDYDQLHKEYLQHLYCLNLPCRWSCNDQQFQATIRGVNAQGQLILEMEDQSTKTFEVKQVSLIR